MTTLLLRFQAPMQSWGISSHFTNRDTGREPSKSGVIGLICSALGRSRDADVSDLANLKMGVRVDREGVLRNDFQVSQEVYQASGEKIEPSVISNRYYLADAAFLVGLEGPEALLREIQSALKNPHWALYLGRKAFPPGKPVWLKEGLQDESLLESFEKFPSLVPERSDKVRLVLESDQGEFVRSDVPISFAERRFSSRRIHLAQMDRPPYEEV